MAAHLGVQCALRYPSYSTHLTDAYTQIHTSSVVTIAPVPHSSAPVSRGHLSLQFSSLDDRGLLCYWLLSETDQVSRFGLHSSLNEEFVLLKHIG